MKNIEAVSAFADKNGEVIAIGTVIKADRLEPEVLERFLEIGAVVETDEKTTEELAADKAKTDVKTKAEVPNKTVNK